jgi:uncharacterized protein (DUF427 family)
MKPIPPKPGQESVWDYPRPPRLEKTSRHLRVEFGGEIIADTNQAYRVLETSHPPVYYIPMEDVREAFLRESSRGGTFCEFKGRAKYWDIVTSKGESQSAAWSYPTPSKAFAPIAGFLAFYASRVDACYVNDEKVQSQEGDFYGGWITSDIVGPFKGGTGTWGW